MPPIPVLDVQSQLANLGRRLYDLRTFQLPRLRGCKGPLDLHQELAEETYGDLERARQTIEVSLVCPTRCQPQQTPQSCKELGESQPRSSDRLATLQACDGLDQDYHR